MQFIFTRCTVNSSRILLQKCAWKLSQHAGKQSVATCAALLGPPQSHARSNHHGSVVQSCTFGSGCYHKFHAGCNHTLATTSLRHLTTSPFRDVPIKRDDVLLEKEGMFKSAYNKVKWIFSDKPKRGAASFDLYEKCADLIDYDIFFKSCALPDTLFSWFLIIELHVWMCQVRLMAEGEVGRYMRNEIMNAFWMDTEERLKKLTEMPSSKRRQILRDLDAHFKAAMFSYDEGLMSEDKVLAGALWRTFFSYECDDPSYLELMVAYVRNQIDHLDSIHHDELFKGKLTWVPFKEAAAVIR